MIDPVTAIMFAKAAYGIYQTASGIKDAQGIERPIQEMPTGILEAENIYRQRAGRTRLPGQDAYEAEVDLDTANYAGKAMTSAGSPAEASQYLLTGLNQSNIEKRKLASEAMKYQDANEVRLAEQENRKAAYEDKLFNINQLAPYMDAARAASAKMGAGITNISNSADSFAGYLQSQDFLKEATFYSNGNSRGTDIPAPMSTPTSGQVPNVPVTPRSVPDLKIESTLNPWWNKPMPNMNEMGRGGVPSFEMPNMDAFDISKAIEYSNYFN